MILYEYETKCAAFSITDLQDTEMDAQINMLRKVFMEYQEYIPQPCLGMYAFSIDSTKLTEKTGKMYSLKKAVCSNPCEKLIININGAVK